MPGLPLRIVVGLGNPGPEHQMTRHNAGFWCVDLIARQHGEDAVARGVFGSPWIFVDGEPFWGSDRLPMVERWLEGRW